MLDNDNPVETPVSEAPAEPSQAPPVADTPAESPVTESDPAEAPVKKAAAKKAATKKAPAKKVAAKKTAAKRTTKKVAEEPASAEADDKAETPETLPLETAEAAPAKKAAAKKTTAKKSAAKKTTAKRATKKTAEAPAPVSDEQAPDQSEEEAAEEAAAAEAAAAAATMLLFQAPEPTKTPPRKKKAAAKPEPEPAADEAEAPEKAEERPAKAERAPKQAAKAKREADEAPAEAETDVDDQSDRGDSDDTEGEGGGGNRRRRRRGGRRRRKSGGENDSDNDESTEEDSSGAQDTDRQGNGPDADDSEGGTTASRRRRRRRRAGEESDGVGDDPENTVTRVRKPRTAEDEITSVSGSTRLEAKKQRRREGREAGRRRAPIVSEAEFLARREAVDRVMVIRQKKDLTQIAVMEDKVLVEHYVARESQTSLIGNVYLGRVQNVLPSMEAAFIDIGKGRNAVLYAGEVNWDSLGAKDGQPRKIESVLKSGQSVLVQVTKDPIGHKGARLTSQISLPGRFLVYVPDGTTSGISRKLPDTERNRLKALLKEIVPDSAGVIVRTAAEGASEDELTRDVERLTARWEDIQAKVKGGNAPQLLYGEPDLTLKVVRDLFTEDFGKLVVAGGDAWDMVEDYVKHVAPDLSERLEKYDGDQDVFAAYRIDEQIAKGLDRKVWLPSGGSLIIDRTEAMTVVDVNTGKFTGSGGNLEETVTKNNLEAAEEIVRQLRLRDIGGIIVVDFIDMVLESNRDLVLRRMVECLGRDRTRHQVAEVTSLGLVQMTRKRIGTGLLEAFSENCEHCQGRGLVIHQEPIEPKKKADDEPRRSRRSGRSRGRDDGDTAAAGETKAAAPSPKDVAAMAKHEPAPDGAQKRADESAEWPTAEPVEQAAEKPAEKPAEVPAAQAAEKPVEHAPEPEPEAAPAEPEAAPVAAEAGPPKVSTRRRGAGRARRESGPPVVEQSATEQSAAEQAPVTTPAADVSPVEQPPVEVPSAPEQSAPEQSAEEQSVVETTPPVEAAAPRVVTSVRRRTAVRQAGPPPGVAAGTTAVATEDRSDAASSNGQTDGETSHDSDEHAATAHVPIKKKGSRKR